MSRPTLPWGEMTPAVDKVGIAQRASRTALLIANCAAWRQPQSCRPRAAGAQVVRAWAALQASAPALGELQTFRYDLVDVARQALSKRATAMWQVRPSPPQP